ncbi:HNH endonuclease [Rhodohalobacter mucosus]|uniref:HNH nuclease domain-containing protein n=1 Tax=Rhodohalobacter mucosus TaxID=2079485 RepID=A0A316TQE4_9BACT|nr:HNH endonuclease [Rhodohalobacter mucosus]PWN05449.1 hypothetical protein DDZ15_15400 [Rhodohalobacter mucosus]
MKDFTREIEPILNLNSDRSHAWDDRTRGRAPHKPFLLLSILDGIDQGWITDNRIELSRELIDTFFLYWNATMGTDKVTTIALPFFHMKSEPFWELKYREGEKEYTYSPSLGSLQSRVEYAILKPDLYRLMDMMWERNALRQLLAGHYFDDDTAGHVLKVASLNFEARQYAVLTANMAADPFIADHSKNVERKRKVQFKQVRETGFSITVRKNYENACAFCRSRVETPGGQTLVEGAHIIPWSESNNDDPRNGLSLCRSHHWMFDNMMITVRDDYTIRISSWLEKNRNRVEETLKLKNCKILLPVQEMFFPHRVALLHHNERFEVFHKKN